MVRKKGSCVLSIRLLGAGQRCLLESLWAKQLSVNYAQRRTGFPAGKGGSREKHVLILNGAKVQRGSAVTKQSVPTHGRVLSEQGECQPCFLSMLWPDGACLLFQHLA